MKCFVIMPFREQFDEVYAAIQRATMAAIPGETISVVRLDDVKSAGRITDDLLQEIRTADFCVADVTDLNSNVMWEVGFAAALQKPTIAITHSADPLPFDIHDLRVFRYNRQSLETTLVSPLEDAIKHTLARYEVPRRSQLMRLPERTIFSVAITGSNIAEPNRAARRVEALVAPYLGTQTTWYCGTFGTVDQAAATYLISQKQRVIAVGFGAYDISEEMLHIVQSHNVPFIAANQEQLPRIPGAPDERNLLFLIKADLVILVWDGKSAGTAAIINFMRQQGRDHIVGFV